MSSTLLMRLFIAVAGVFVIAPMILFCLLPAVVRAWFESGPDAVETGAPAESRSLIADLQRLGFQALGVKVEKTPLRPAVRELSFVAGDRRCYASIAGSRLKSRLYYYTPLPEGGLVLSSNGAFPKISSASVAQRSYLGCGAQELLERHYEALAALGWGGEVVPTAEARVEATYLYYQTPEVRSVLRRTGVVLLVSVALLGWLLVR